MRWERLFEDLQDQFASEWETERAALDTEAERLRLARLPLRARLTALARPIAPEVVVELVGGISVRGTISAVGEDWVGFEGEQIGVVRTAAVLSIAMAQADVLRSAREEAPLSATLAERMGFGFVLRDLARRRAGVIVHRTDGTSVGGTIDRAAADHLDLAVHDADVPRRASAVTGLRLVPYAAVAWVRVRSAR